MARYTSVANRSKFVDYDELGKLRQKEEEERKQRELEQAYIQSNEQQPNRSTLDRVFDALSVGQYTTLGVIDEGLKGFNDNGTLGMAEGATKGLVEGLKASNPFGKGNEKGEYNTKQVLENHTDWENYGQDKWSPTWFLKGAVEFAGDVLLDPTTYVGGSAIKQVVKGTGTVSAKGVKKGLGEVTEVLTRDAVREIAEKAGKVLDDSQIDSYTRKLNKLRGVSSDLGKDITFAGHKIIDGDTLRSFGDKTIAPYFNMISDSIKSSPVAKLFNTSYQLREVAKTDPEYAIKLMNFIDQSKNIKRAKLKGNEEIMRYVQDVIGQFPETTQRKIMDLIENPNSYKDMVDLVPTANDDVLTQFDELVEELTNKKFVKQDELGVVKKAHKLAKDLINDEDVVEKLLEPENAEMARYYKKLLDPDNRYKTIEDFLEAFTGDDAERLLQRSRDSFDELVAFPEQAYKIVDEKEGLRALQETAQEASPTSMADNLDEMLGVRNDGQIGLRMNDGELVEESLTNPTGQMENLVQPQIDGQMALVDDKGLPLNEPRTISMAQHTPDAQSYFDKGTNNVSRATQEKAKSVQEQMFDEILKQRQRVGYVPNINEHQFSEVLERASRGELEQVKALDVNQKVDWVNENLFEGRKVLSYPNGNGAYESTRIDGILDKVAKSDGSKQSIGKIKQDVFQITNKGKEFYSYLMSKYGDGVKKVSDMQKKFEIEEKAFRKVDKQYQIANFYEYERNIKAQKEILREVLSTKQATPEALKILGVKEGADYQTLRSAIVNKNAQFDDLLANHRTQLSDYLKKNYGSSKIPPYSNYYSKNGTLEERFQNAYDTYSRASHNYNNRIRERDALSNLTQRQYELYRTKYSDYAYDQINPKANRTTAEIIDRISQLSDAEIMREMNQETASLFSDMYTRSGDDIATEILEDTQKKVKEPVVGERSTLDTNYNEQREFDLKEGEMVRVKHDIQAKASKQLAKYTDRIQKVYQNTGSNYVRQQMEATLGEQEKWFKLLNDWVDGASLKGLPNFDEAYNRISKMDEVNLYLTNEQAEKFILEHEKSGKWYMTDTPFLTQGNREQVATSYLATMLGKEVRVYRDADSLPLATNLYRKTKNGSIRVGDKLQIRKRASHTIQGELQEKARQEQFKKGLNTFVQSDEPISTVLPETNEAMTALKEVHNIPHDVTDTRQVITRVVEQTIKDDEVIDLARYIDENGEVVKEVYDPFNKTSSQVHEATIRDLQELIRKNRRTLPSKQRSIQESIEALDKACVDDEILTTMLNERLKGTPNLEGYTVKDSEVFLNKVKRVLASDDVTLSDEVLRVADDISIKLRQMGEEEASIGKLRDFIEHYVPHVLNPEIKNNPEIMAKLKQQDLELYQQVLTYSGDKFNPYSLSRSQAFEDAVKDVLTKDAVTKGMPVENITGKTVAQVNEAMKPFLKQFGFDGDFFINEIGDAFLIRAMKHNEVIYSNKFADELISEFGSVVNPLGIKKNGRYYVTQKELKGLFMGLPDAQQRQLFEELGFNSERVYNRMLIELNGEEMQRFLSKSQDLGVPLNGYELPEYLANQAVNTGYATQFKETNNFLKIYDHFTNIWKQNVTLLTPGFHMRNKFSNTFLNYLAVGQEVFDGKNRSLVKSILNGDTGELVTKSGQKIDFDSIRRELIVNDVVDGSRFKEWIGEGTNKTLIGNELNGSGNGLLEAMRKKLGKASPEKYSAVDPTDVQNFAPYKLGRKIGTNVEEFDRSLNFIVHLKQGLSPTDSAEMVEKFLFDYADLTSFEKNYMKRIIPFYSWIRKNAPLQMEMLMERPGVYRAIAKGTNKLNRDNDPEGNRKYLPEFMEDWVQLPLEINNSEVFLNPNQPYGDLDVFASSPRDLIGMLNPLIKMPVELGTNKNYFFNSQIYREGSESEDIGKYLMSQTGAWNNIKNLSDAIQEGDSVDAGLLGLNYGLGVKLSAKDLDKSKAYSEESLKSKFKQEQKSSSYTNKKYGNLN